MVLLICINVRLISYPTVYVCVHTYPTVYVYFFSCWISDATAVWAFRAPVILVLAVSLFVTVFSVYVHVCLNVCGKALNQLVSVM